MKKRGVGMAYVLHPTGNKGGGDPSHAAIQLKPDGTYVLSIGAMELGQGAPTILRQVAADALGVPIEKILVTNYADMMPLSVSTSGSRVTLIDPHAVVNAAEDLKRRIREFVASAQGVKAEDVVVDGEVAYARSNPERTRMTMAQIGHGAAWGGAYDPMLLIGTGSWQPGRAVAHDPETGAMDNVGGISYGAALAEVEVDTETGVVDVIKFAQVWEVGKAINPLMVRAQINGGFCIGAGFALQEAVYPYYPSADMGPTRMGDYFMPTFQDYPQEMLYGIEEVPNPKGVEGSKGFAEGTATGPVPAIASAIHDAIGVWITDFPITPEVVLRALQAKDR